MSKISQKWCKLSRQVLDQCAPLYLLNIVYNNWGHNLFHVNIKEGQAILETSRTEEKCNISLLSIETYFFFSLIRII